MREILFRGKRTGNDEWIKGSLSVEWGETDKEGNRSLDYRILGLRGGCVYVIPETVGQYTGLTDKNGKKIFEGDILKCVDEHNDIEFYAAVEFGNPNCEFTWGWQLKRLFGDKANTDILLWVETEIDGVYAEIVDNVYSGGTLLKNGGINNEKDN